MSNIVSLGEEYITLLADTIADVEMTILKGLSKQQLQLSKKTHQACQ